MGDAEGHRASSRYSAATSRMGASKSCGCRGQSLSLSVLASVISAPPLRLWERHQDVLDPFAGVAEEHLAVVPEEQRVLDAGVAGVHRPLEDDDVLGLPDLEHAHTGDRA